MKVLTGYKTLSFYSNRIVFQQHQVTCLLVCSQMAFLVSKNSLSNFLIIYPSVSNLQFSTTRRKLLTM